MRLFFWLLWVLAGTVGWAVGGGETAFGEYPSVPNVIVGGYVRLAAGGILVGALQWLLLRRQIARAGRWVLANIGAVLIVGAIVFGVGAVNADVGWVVGAGLSGTLVGVLQWLVLRGQVARAGWWVVASTLGWIAGMPVGGFLGWAALGAMYGAITGVGIVWLLRQPS